MKIFFDTETTGLLNPNANDVRKQPYIIEICVIKCDDEMNVVEKYTSLVKPPIPISEEITKITKIDERMVKDAPAFSGIYPDLCRIFLGCDTMVAHNLGFDRSMLANELLRLDKLLHFPWPHKHICTVERSMSYEGRRLNLTKLYEKATGKPQIDNAHRAESDVLALMECYKFLVAEGKIK